MMNEELDNRIRVFRAEHRMSQEDLAEAIGVSRKTISTIEVGRSARVLDSDRGHGSGGDDV